MTKTIHVLISFCLLALNAQAQIVSQFDWNTNPVTKAAAGPDATGVSSFATSGTGGAGGTNGLNPMSHDINLVMAGSTFTSLQGIDISIDFLKKENGASFFTLGSFDFGIATGSIYIKYLVKVGGTDVLMTQNAQYLVPNDNAFHTYRFVYNNTTGVATLSVDGVVQHTYTTTGGSPLSWTGAGSATIGSGMDGSGSNVAELDNLLIQYPPVILPLALLSFEAVAALPVAQLSWTTMHEQDLQEFVVERSLDGVTYHSLGSVTAQQGNTTTQTYRFTDAAPAAVNFYRLKMIDIDGSFSYSPVKKVSSATDVAISCYPNPVIDLVNIKVSKTAPYTIATMDGRILQTGLITGGQASLNMSAAPKGILIVRVGNETFKLFKQ